MVSQKKYVFGVLRFTTFLWVRTLNENVPEVTTDSKTYIRDLELDCHPFPHCIIRNFIQSDSFTENLQRELLDLNFHEKSNDLYKLNQSDGLKKRKEPHITGLSMAGLFGWFRSWLGEVLGVELKPTVDISCAKYQYTDVLLCHDDELEGRRVAFILYFVPPWESSDGGTLDLFSADDHFQPHSVVKSLVPSWNTLVLFEVSPVSFHQVSRAVFGATPSSHRAPLAKEPPPSQRLLLEWLTPLHLDVDYQTAEIQLKNFLKEEKFKEVSEALRSTDVQWTKQGPPNRS
ncbi:unnamed protein product [Oncorhynchus mykiss]|uniref:Prolyl 4-hydroxylase alpha subunit domain-containing protein n=1 Tax=Oncorhynchus mykiss TaxID=8022 RepID=A0A060WBI9_ONCMY|nr:unnamed protein product [Oncorhynchus mykiss]